MRPSKLLKKLLKRNRYDIGVEVGPNSTVSRDSWIGAYSYVGRNCVIGKTTVGRYVSIADNVSIGNGEHDITRISTSSMFYQNPYEELTKGDCVIESDVWIGVDAIVRRGVTLGFGCVIGANSFVNRDVPAFAIAAGSPARIIGYRFDEAVRQEILDSKWWEMIPTEAAATIAKLKSRSIGKATEN